MIANRKDAMEGGASARLGIGETPVKVIGLLELYAAPAFLWLPWLANYSTRLSIFFNFYHTISAPWAE